MKVSVRHDGSGNFLVEPPTAGETGPGNREKAGMRCMLASVAQGIGQALLFAAGKRGLPVGRCLVSIEGDADQAVFRQDGMAVTVEVCGDYALLDRLVQEALTNCFPQGSPICPLRHTTIATTRSSL